MNRITGNDLNDWNNWNGERTDSVIINPELYTVPLEREPKNLQSQHSPLNVPNLIILTLLTLILVALIIAGILIRLNKKKYGGVIYGIGTSSVFAIFFLALYSAFTESSINFYNWVMFVLNIVATIVVFVKAG